MSKATVTNMTRGVYRRIYAGFITGRRICGVSEGAEMWFWRVNGIADDFGNGPADPHLCWTLAKGYRRISETRATNYMNELYAANLLFRYEAEGESYFHVIDFLSFQPRGKNGKRVRRHPGCVLEKDEPEIENDSGGIQVNPDSSGYSQRIQCPETETEDHNHNHSETEDQHNNKTESKTTAAPDSDSGKVSQSFSGSGSEDTRRRLASQLWGMEVSKLWARGQDHAKQRKSDATSTPQLFELVWPAGMTAAEGQPRADHAMTLIRKAAQNGDRPMAWFTAEIKKLATAAGGVR